LSIDKIGLGTVQFGLNYGISNKLGQTSFKDSLEIVIQAKHNGINLLDTASSYGNSEIILGKMKLNEMKIVSKFISNNSKDLKIEFQNTLNRLNCKGLYGYLCHRPENVLSDNSLWSVLEEFRCLGKIKKIGFSFTDPDQIDKCLRLKIIPDIVQVPFNIFDQRFLNGIKILKSKFGTEIHTRSVFLQGLFFLKPEKLMGKTKIFKNYLIELNKVCENSNDKIIRYALNYCTSNHYIDKVIVGIQSTSQMNDLLTYSKYSNPNKFKYPIVIENKLKKYLDPANW